MHVKKRFLNCIIPIRARLNITNHSVAPEICGGCRLCRPVLWRFLRYNY